MIKQVSVYYHNCKGKPARLQYRNVTAIRAGSARDIIGIDDATGNGISPDAPLIQIIMDDGNTATFDADNVTVM